MKATRTSCVAGKPAVGRAIASAMFAVSLSGGTPALADTIYTTFPYASNLSWPVMGNSRPGGPRGCAVKFTPSTDYSFDSAQVELYYTGWYGNKVSFSLTSNDNARGCPGTVLELFPTVSVSSGTWLTTFSSTSHPELVSGTTYWLVGLPGDSTSDVIWLPSSTAVGNVYETTNGGSSWNVAWGSPYQLPVAAIYGTPVPEPASLSLMIPVAVGLLRRRTRRGRLQTQELL